MLYPVELRAHSNWSGWRDSNSRPTAPKAVALPGCATPRPKITAGQCYGVMGVSSMLKLSKTLNKRQKKTTPIWDGFLFNNGAPGEIRTPDRSVRSRVLYPAELRAHGGGELSDRGGEMSTHRGGNIWGSALGAAEGLGRTVGVAGSKTPSGLPSQGVSPDGPAIQGFLPWMASIRHPA